MYGIDATELANIDSLITRTLAMIDSCQRFDAPAEAFEVLNSRLAEYHTERGLILSRGVKADYRTQSLRESGREYQGR